MPNEPTWVIKLIGMVNGQASEHDDNYVREYDPSVTYPGWSDDMQRAGECWLVTTPDPLLAKQYASYEEAMADWNRVDEREPLRPDGQPNRPLTIFSILLEQWKGVEQPNA